MQDETLIQPALAAPARQGTSARVILLIALLAFALGLALAALLLWRGDIPLGWAKVGRNDAQQATPVVPLVQQAKPGAAGAQMLTIGGVETRLALLEERLSRLDLRADAASGNAARAEGLLIAFAARRIVAKGSPLGFLEDQLKLRFGGAQPDAVRTVIAFAREPVTLDQLAGGLDALAPSLVETPKGDSGWTRLQRELSALFVVRRASTPSVAPRDRIQRARVMLMSGKTADAITEIERMPGAEAAQTWIDSARRYDGAQQALDVIETAAMLEPRRLQDAEGRAVAKPSPLAQPTEPEAAP